MKKIIVILLSIFISINVYAATNPYKEKIKLCDECEYITNCTWFAWKMAYEQDGVILPMLNDAKNWYDNAAKQGYSVGKTPKAHSIVVWGNRSAYGHVGYVVSVNGDSIGYKDSTSVCYKELTPEQQSQYMDCLMTKTTSEADSYLCDHLKYGEVIPCSNPINDPGIIGYIYLDVPKTGTTTTTTSNNNPTTTTTTQQEILKSNNNYLKSLVIPNVDLEFNKETKEYSIRVKNHIKSIEISGELDDEKATVVGFGTKELNVGSNTFKIEVTAENGDKREYIVNVNREKSDMELVIEPQPLPVDDTKDLTNRIIKDSIYTLAMIFLVLLFIIIYKVRKLKHKIK